MRISIALALLTGTFETDLKRAEAQTRRRMQAIKKEFENAGKAIGLAFTAATAAFVIGTKRAIDAADALDNMSQRTGVSVEALSRLEVAAKLSDTSLESLQKGIVQLSKAQLEAAEGGQEQIAIFRAFGLEVDELRAMKPEEVMKRIADGFQNLENPADRAALAFKLFGRAGVDLIPLLIQGSEKLSEFEKLSDELGVTISQETAKAAADFNDQLDILRLGLDGVFRKAAKDLLPAITQLAKQFNDPNFRDGFATIITGATNAAIAVANLISTIGNLTKFVGEELAARVAGPDAFDTVRVEQRMERLRTTIQAVQNASILDPLALFDASELIPSDFLSQKDTVIARLQQELNKEENKLKLAIELTPTGPGQPTESPTVEPDADPLKAYIEELKRLQEEQAKAAAAASAQSAANKAAADAEREAAEKAAQARLEEHEQRMDLIRLRNEENEQRAEEARAIAEEKARIDEILADLAFEKELLGMTNLEREKAIALRYANVDAASEEGKAIAVAIEEVDKTRQLAEGMDAVRSATKGLFQDLLEGTKSAKDAFKDFAAAVLSSIAEILAQRLTEQLFGSMGSSGGGSAGGFIADVFGSLFGGGRAVGGAVYAGKYYEVGENDRPELYMSGGKQFLIPGNSGRVMPMGATTRGGDTIIIQGATSTRSLERIRMERDRADRKAQREFG